jgi:DNA-cytosine methyltransferase
VCNQHDTYTVVFKKTKDLQDKAFYENGYIWTPINGVDEEEYSGLVYNLSVENDESYMIQNIICHNCTDISLAGKLKGLNPDDNTRSSLIWQTIRLLNKAKETDTLPEYMMLENVKNLVGKKFIKDFETFNSLIEEFGYNVYWKVLNARDCGVPQNRERVFAIYIRKDIDKGNFTFPEPFDNGLRLKDVLEEEVDEKYYINTEKANQLLQRLLDDGVIGNNSNT